MEKQGSASPRPPPLDRPPPVPSTKPEPQSITETSIGIPLTFDDSKPSRSRNRRRRRASLPAMNILPSFKSLKSVMGFGADDEDKNDDEAPSNPADVALNGDLSEHHDPSHSTTTPNAADGAAESTANDKDSDRSPSSSTTKGSKPSNAGGSTKKKFPKRTNPKELKAMYIKNLKLQSEVDRVGALNRSLQSELDDAREEIGDLQDQIAVKQRLVQQLNSMSEAVSESKEDATAKCQRLEELLQERDAVIARLNAQIKTLRNEMHIPSDFTIATASGQSAHSLSVDQYGADGVAKDPHKQHVE